MLATYFLLKLLREYQQYFKEIHAKGKYNIEIDGNNVCHLFTVQFGRYRNFNVQDKDYKDTINRINKGVKKYRNVSPSFVLTLRLFLDLLRKRNVEKIVIPDFLFSRYKNYYKASTTGRSDSILARILGGFLTLMQRMEYQFDDVEIEYYPNEIDSYTHISLNDEKKKELCNK